MPVNNLKSYFKYELFENAQLYSSENICLQFMKFQEFIVLYWNRKLYLTNEKIYTKVVYIYL